MKKLYTVYLIDFMPFQPLETLAIKRILIDCHLGLQHCLREYWLPCVQLSLGSMDHGHHLQHCNFCLHDVGL